MPETEKALPTGVGFSDFNRLCKESPKAVICAGHPGKMLTVEQVQAIDKVFRARFIYRSDMATAGVDDYWRNWSLCGDCEDYVLSLSELLAQHGEDGQYMQLQLMLAPANEQWTEWTGHATLWITTSDAGVVEAEVGELGNPHPLNMKYGKRMATIRMDGLRTPVALPGFRIDVPGMDVVWDKKK